MKRKTKKIWEMIKEKEKQKEQEQNSHSINNNPNSIQIIHNYFNSPLPLIPSNDLPSLFHFPSSINHKLQIHFIKHHYTHSETQDTWDQCYTVSGIGVR